MNSVLVITRKNVLASVTESGDHLRELESHEHLLVKFVINIRIEVVTVEVLLFMFGQ